MSDASSDRMTAVEEHVLRTFASHEATTLATSLLFDESAPFAHADIARALARLEHEERTLIRYTWNGADWVTLTLRGVTQRGGPPSPRGTSRHPEIVYEHSHRIRSGGHEYTIYVLGAERTDGTWAGWIEFCSGDAAPRLRTGQETSQPNRDALAYWASGLEDIYLEGALSRAAA